MISANFWDCMDFIFCNKKEELRLLIATPNTVSYKNYVWWKVSAVGVFFCIDADVCLVIYVCSRRERVESARANWLIFFLMFTIFIRSKVFTFSTVTKLVLIN
jgi:hypothetical protein